MKKIYLIGEIGINHNGSVKIAKKIISEAKGEALTLLNFKKEIQIFQPLKKKNMKLETLHGVI